MTDYTSHKPSSNPMVLTLTPDFRDQHLAIPLLHFLQEHGVEVIAAIPQDFSIAEMKRIYINGATYERSKDEKALEIVYYGVSFVRPYAQKFKRIGIDFRLAGNPVKIPDAFTLCELRLAC